MCESLRLSCESLRLSNESLRLSPMSALLFYTREREREREREEPGRTTPLHASHELLHEREIV